MIRPRSTVALALGAILAAYACGEPTNPSPSEPLVAAPSFAPKSAACDVSQLASLARNYFSPPEQKTTTDTLRAMYDECTSGAGAAVVAGGWTILSTIESVIDAGSGGSADDGASLANGVMAYMGAAETDLYTPPPAAVTPDALGSQGIFAVRGDDDTDIVAHGNVPFTFQGKANNALWGLQTSSTWMDATGAATILIYGSPGSLPPVAETAVADLAFQLHTFPDVPGFKDGLLHVGVCYESDLALSGTANLLQREGTLLQPYSPTFDGCRQPSDVATANHGVLGTLLAMAGRAFLPRPLLAAVGGTYPPSTGGSPIDFSHFAPVAVDPAGQLQFVTPPSDGVADTALATIRVEALSGAGTPIERVQIQLYVAGNDGEPAGATFCDPMGGPCQDTATTVEAASGYGTVATFTDATLYKPGGYVICARAISFPSDEEGVTFTLQDVCADMIHVKN